ncbi:sensor histidine kinase [Paractinoplanes durhamensis]|uniref:histidine kinase n=1 Tax=Paractinoplanes durhamensis TaxID=113563 RepID=A0ABQ3ZD62_9ACTN|nr:HAMP domain-containing sensor histidine kinase [Actinoplanes durhamensis]GIE07772.1 two-component sensor histidine kinase [Actinoplanes durhamensis]
MTGAGWRPTVGVRVRILATVLVLAGLGMLVTGATSLLVAHRQQITAIDADLRTEVDEFHTHIQRLSGEGATDVRSLLRSALREQVPMDEQVLLGMVDGVPAYVTRGERPFPLEKESGLIAAVAALPPGEPTRIRQATTTSAGTIRYAVVQLRVAGRPQRGVLAVATSLRPAYAQLAQSAWQYAALSAGALVLIGVGGWLVAGRLLRPLRLLRTAADRISHTDLTARIPVTSRDDVTELTVTVNRMLDRLEWAFDTQQQFLDDAGHELRTPLTIVRGHLDVLDVGDPAEVAATRDIVTDELDRMARLVDDLVLLAQSQRPDFVRMAPVDLDRLLREALDKAQALADRRWVLDATPPIVVLADAQRLTQALLQLAHNAVKHTGAQDVIAFGGMQAPGGVLLWVRDSGPGVPEEDVERIFERFQRARAARGTEGSGLGLSIVAGIAAAHDGRVALDQGGPGARFSLMLPLRVVSRTPGPTRRPGGRYLPAEPSVPYPDEWSHR